MKFTPGSLSILFFLLCSVFINAEDFTDIDALFDKAVEYERQGDFELALESLSSILELEPENKAALVRTAKLLSWENQFEEALSLLDQALALDKNLEEALFRKGQILGWMGNYDASIDLFIQYLQVKPQDSEGLLAIGRVYFWNGEYTLALQNFDASEKEGADARVTGTERAKVYLAMEQNDLAERELQNVLLEDPQYQEARRLLDGLEKIYFVEIFPVSGMLSIYPDHSLGLSIDPGVVFHLRNRWDVLFINEIQTVEELWDNTLRLGVVYRGIENLYLGLDTSFTPMSNFHPVWGIKGSVHGSIGESFGAGLSLKGDFFDSPTASMIGKETLLEVTGDFSTYFGDINYMTVSGSWFQYLSGYNAIRVSLSTLVEYYKGNSITAGISYGGSVEVMDSQRKTMELGTGINQSISPLVDISAFYNYMDTTFGQTHQIGVKTYFHW